MTCCEHEVSMTVTGFQHQSEASSIIDFDQPKSLDGRFVYRNDRRNCEIATVHDYGNVPNLCLNWKFVHTMRCQP